MAASAPRTCAAAVSAAAWAVSMSDWAMRPASRSSRARLSARSVSARSRFGGRELGLARLDLRGGRAGVGLERAERRRGALGGTGGLHRIDLRQHLSGLHAVAFLHAQRDQAAHAGRADVGKARGDDLARRGDERLKGGGPGHRRDLGQRRPRCPAAGVDGERDHHQERFHLSECDACSCVQSD